MSTSIYPELNSKINSILSGIKKIKAIYPYPASKVSAYPAAIFYPSGFDNAFETGQENMKRYGYKLWITINTGATDIETGYEILARVMDEVLEALDDGWSFDSINGHRVWGKVDSGDWQVNEVQNGLEISAEIDLSIKMLTN